MDRCFLEEIRKRQLWMLKRQICYASFSSLSMEFMKDSKLI